MKKLLVILLVFLSAIANAQDITRMLFIFDASNSMNGKWEGSTKIDRAREILTETITELKSIPDLELGLRVYGHQSPITPVSQDCNDTKLEIPFEANNHDQIINFILNVEPKGTTPIARSLEEAANDFPDKTTRNVIVLITDGLEACEGFPCEVAKSLKDKGVNVTPFVVGLGIDLAYLNDFSCIGRFYEASTLQSFEKVMKSVVSDALNSTTLQIDLNNISGEAKETNTTVFFYEAGTKNLKYTFMHTMNYEGNPDTISIVDPKLKYDVVANTLPKVEIKNVGIVKGRHNHIDLETPQGALGVKVKGKTTKHDISVVVTQKGECRTLNVQSTQNIQKYIVGEYEVEILTLPRIYEKSVSIEQSVYNYITIPGSGSFSFQSYKPIIGQIFLKKGSGEQVWVCDIASENRQSYFHLQPGEYRVVYRDVNATSTDYTLFKDFQIISGDRVSVKL
ncbi:MAG: VWA domain-containing protein [Crocinitomicaceae bacterium]